MNAKINNELLAVAEAALELARRCGADAADVDVVDARSVSATSRLGKIEDVNRSEGQDLALRVFVGQSSAVVSTNDMTPATLDTLAERAVAMARLAPADEYAGLAGVGLLATSWPDLDLYDPASPDADALFALALEAEDAGRGVKGIDNSLGASAGASHTLAVLATSEGFAGAYQGSRFSVSAGMISGTGAGMENDYAYSSARHLADMQPAATVGLEAGIRAAKRQGPKKPATFTGTVVYEPRTARMLLGHLAGAVNGRSVARGSSFLKSKMGEAIFAPGVTVIDDPLRIRGAASRPFDGEGLAGAKRAVVSDGRLEGWTLDLASARQLEMTPTGQASRGGGTPGPSTANFYMEAGDLAVADLIGAIDHGVLITDMIGMGVNLVSGDYSRGASGFLIEKGEILYAVSGFTIAGHLGEMFARAKPADDLVFKYATNAPTLAIEGMTIAGT